MIAARPKPAAVLIVNRHAGRLSHTSREEVVACLGEHLSLDVVSTVGREDATAVASRAASDGARLVVAFGGDGHVNEVVNGLAGTASTLAIVPGGTMNVFARSLGIPRSPMDAVAHLGRSVALLPRTVHLGKMDDRYFTFSAGCGFDAEVAALVDHDVPNKRRFGEIFFYWSALRVLAGAYRHRKASMMLSGPFGEEAVSMAIACNTGPYAYLLGRAVEIAPEVRLDGGLDVFALRRMRIEALPSYTLTTVVTGSISRHGDALYERDLEGFTISSDRPFARHVDGEPVEPSTHASFALERDALKVHV